MRNKGGYLFVSFFGGSVIHFFYCYAEDGDSGADESKADIDKLFERFSGISGK